MPSDIWPMNWRMTAIEPPHTIEPSCGSRSPAIIRIKVVLPAPFGPTSAAVAPLGTRKVTSSSSGRPSGQ